MSTIITMITNMIMIIVMTITIMMLITTKLRITPSYAHMRIPDRPFESRPTVSGRLSARPPLDVFATGRLTLVADKWGQH